MSKLFTGACSWKYDSWRGIIYSDKRNINYLQEYSHYFETVEIDQWFWSLGKSRASLPIPSVVRAYQASVGDHFKFSIKMPNSLTLTHHYQNSKSEILDPNPYFLSIDLLQQFLHSIEPMRNNLGPLMFQFEYLNKKKMPEQLYFQDLFSAFASQLPKGFTWAVEIRNPNYLNISFFQFLKENKLVPVFLQGYYMPPIFEIYEKYKDLITNKAVIRLHGPDRKGIENLTGKIWDRIVAPKDQELEKITRMIEDLLSREVDVFLNVNNHYEGCAPKTIFKIQEILKGS